MVAYKHGYVLENLKLSKLKLTAGLITASNLLIDAHMKLWE